MYNFPFPFEQLDIRVLIAPAKLYIVHGKLYIVHGKLYIMNYAFPSSQAVILSLFWSRKSISSRAFSRQYFL